MFVVPVVVTVRVFMLRRLVRVLVAMRFGQVQQHAGQHQPTARGHQPAGRTVAQQHGEGRTDEGRISDALVPLVRCKPQASATGPTTAPKAAMASRRGRSLRMTRASRSMRLRNRAPIAAAPA